MAAAQSGMERAWLAAAQSVHSSWQHGAAGAQSAPGSERP